MPAYDLIYRRRNGNDNGTEDIIADASTGLATLQYKTIVLTNAQILSLVTVPVLLVPPPGQDRFVAPVRLTYITNITVPYGNMHASCKMNIRYVGFPLINVLEGLDEAMSKRKVSQLFAKGHRFATLGQVKDGDIGVLAPNPFPGFSLINQGLEAFMVNGSLGNLTGGDPANTVTMMLEYVALNVFM